MLVAKKRN